MGVGIKGPGVWAAHVVRAEMMAPGRKNHTHSTSWWGAVLGRSPWRLNGVHVQYDGRRKPSGIFPRREDHCSGICMCGDHDALPKAPSRLP